jgi:hypothetical protein
MIPLATTTVTVTRSGSTAYDDGYDTLPAPTIVAAGVRAHLSAPSGREAVDGGSAQTVQWRLTCDPVDLHHADTVTDDSTGDVWDVVWAQTRTALGLAHTVAGLTRASGVTG